MGTSVGPSSGTSTGLSPQYQRLIQQTLRIESQPKIDLENQREQKKNKKSAVNDLDGKLSSLQTQLDTLTDTTTNPFEGRTASAEDGTTAFSVSADETASTGTHSLSVNRLASEDGRVSKEYTSGGSDIDNAFSSDQTFNVEVATPSDSGTDRKSVQVDVSASDLSGTNEEVLNNIKSAVDSAFQSAVDDGTIASDERPDVSVVNPTSDTARLSIRSSQTGYDGRLGFSDSTDGLLSSLEVNADQLADDTRGGELTEVGTDESSSKLTSEFTLDGLTLTRNSNTVDDALEGVTINLDEANGTESNFEVASDVEGAKTVVEDFVDKVNEVITFLKEETDLAPSEGEERGTLADDGTFRRLDQQLRTDATSPVDGQPEGLNTLADIGIEANRDGTLKLSDENALEDAVRNNQDAVKSLFNSSDGVATRLENRVDQFVGAGDLLDSRTDSIDRGIDRMDDRIDQFDERLERRQQQLRDRFANVQSTIRSLASQQQAISARL